MTTWRMAITEEMERVGESWDDVVHVVVGKTGRDYDTDRVQGSLDMEFDNGYGRCRGAPFTLWTKARVYFPVTYDGAEWACSVPRDPCDTPTEHVGG